MNILVVDLCCGVVWLYFNVIVVFGICEWDVVLLIGFWIIVVVVGLVVVDIVVGMVLFDDVILFNVGFCEGIEVIVSLVIVYGV